ncbi:MAG: trans-aconitate 2-methyltransferase [Afipia sp.]
MTENGRRTHWEQVYTTKGEKEVSWFQENAEPSLSLLKAVGANPAHHVIDIGGGASSFVDALIKDGYEHVTVLDLSEAALATARARLGNKASKVEWIASDVTQWQPSAKFDVWHDRAAFHFLTAEADRSAYIEHLRNAVKPGGHAIIATFALDGPEKCSGLPVVRYSGETLAETLGDAFQLVATQPHQHKTPWESNQSFQFSTFRLT